MTSPITPDPSIHKVPLSQQKAQTLTPYETQKFQQWGTNLLNAIVSKVVHIITFGIIPEGAVNGALTNLENWWGGFLNDVHSALTWKPNLPTTTVSTNTRVSDVADAARGTRRDATRGITDLVPQSRLPIIPVSHIAAADSTANLLVGGGFDNAANLDYLSSYAWDGTVGRTGVGSAKATGNGSAQALFSNSIDAYAGQSFTLGGWVKWSGVSATGAAFSVSVSTYLGSTLVGTTVLGSVNNPAASGGWVNLAGTYTVPCVQSVIVNGSPTGGSFTLKFNGATTAPIAYNATAGAVQSALEALSSVGPGNVSVTLTSNVYRVTFSTSVSGGQTAMTPAVTFTGGTSPSVTSYVSATVDNIRLKLSVNASVTAGTVWWDDLTAFKTGILDGVLVSGLGTTTGSIIDDLQGAIDGIHQGVNGGTDTGNVLSSVKSNLNTVKSFSTNLQTSLIQGYQVVTISSSVPWVVPADISEIYVALFGGGGKGSQGSGGTSSPQAGGSGGVAGGFISQQLDPSVLTAGSSVACTVGMGTSVGGQDTSFGSFVSTSSAFKGYVATPLGLLPTGASATAGGNGGATNASGVTAATTIVGVAGGSGGASRSGSFSSGNPGGSGSNGLTFGLCYTGGSGGGGGGGLLSSYYGVTTGGAGGSGGVPSGGGGGGGGSTNATGIGPGTGGPGGNGGQGVILIIYKTAST